MTNITLPLPTSASSPALAKLESTLPPTSPAPTSPQPKQPPAYVSSKLTREHLQRYAILYVRQSTSQQLRDHQESTARQYRLTERLAAFGWPDDRIIVIDEDLGISGSGKATRTGFRRLLKLVTEQQVGIVLGLKGIISEMELHTMKIRLERGRLNKAQRGELFHDVPVGFVRGDDGLPLLDPDVSAQHAMKMFFDLFETLGSSHGLFLHLATHNIKLPFRTRGGPIDWRLPAKTTVYGLLKHPLFAGAYGYGRRKNYASKTAEKLCKKTPSSGTVEGVDQGSFPRLHHMAAV